MKLACEQALRGALSAGREIKTGGELASSPLEFEFQFQSPWGSPSSELSDFHQSARRWNERECKQTLKTRAKGNDVITNVISVNQHSASILMQIFKLQRRSLLTTPQQSAPESLLAGETEAKEPNQSRSVWTSDGLFFWFCLWVLNNLTVTSTVDSFFIYLFCRGPQNHQFI